MRFSIEDFSSKWDQICSFLLYYYWWLLLTLRLLLIFLNIQRHPSRGVIRKKCFENMQQIYRRTLMPKCDFNKVTSQFLLKSYYCMGLLCNLMEIKLRRVSTSVNLLLIFRKNFAKLLYIML